MELQTNKQIINKTFPLWSLWGHRALFGWFISILMGIFLWSRRDVLRESCRVKGGFDFCRCAEQSEIVKTGEIAEETINISQAGRDFIPDLHGGDLGLEQGSLQGYKSKGGRVTPCGSRPTLILSTSRDVFWCVRIEIVFSAWNIC